MDTTTKKKIKVIIPLLLVLCFAFILFHNPVKENVKIYEIILVDDESMPIYLSLSQDQVAEIMGTMKKCFSLIVLDQKKTAYRDPGSYEISTDMGRYFIGKEKGRPIIHYRRGYWEWTLLPSEKQYENILTQLKGY